MRIASALLFILLVTGVVAAGHNTHRTHIVNTGGDVEYELVRSDDEHWAAFKRNGVRYVTTDPAVLAEIETAMEAHHELSREHSRLGRRHSQLGREHSRLGREHSRLGRAHARGGDVRELEKEQRKLEEKQRELESRQEELESEQRELEARQRVVERETNRDLERIFEKAVRDGKARRRD